MPKNRGFSLVELLVVVSLITVLSVVGLVMFQSARGKAQEAKYRGDIDAIKKAFEKNYDPTANFGQGGYKPLSQNDFVDGIPKDKNGNSLVVATAPPAPDGSISGFAACVNPSAGEICYIQSATCYCAINTQGQPINIDPTSGQQLCDPFAVLGRDMVAHWRFDEGSGNIAASTTPITGLTTTNRITNPSFETNTTSWGVAGGGIAHARSNEQAFFGDWSDKVTWSSNVNHYAEHALSASPNTPYSITMYVNSSSTNGCLNYWEISGTGGGTAQGIACPTLANTWQKLNLNLTTRSDTAQLRIRFFPTAGTSSGTAYFDGVQVEQRNSPTNYCDGSLGDNRSWSGIAHGSTATCTNNTDVMVGKNITWNTQCIAGNCLSFNGKASATDIATVNDIKSITFWVKPTSFTTTTPLIQLSSSVYVTANGSGNLNATGFSSPTYYVNGEEENTLEANNWNLVTITSETGVNANNIILANRGNDFLNGSIDDVRFYSKVLTAQEIELMYNDGDGCAP